MKHCLCIVLAMSLGGCGETVRYVATSKPFDKAISPVCVSKDDQMTEGTAQKVEGNNLAINKLTGARCPNTRG